MGGHPAGADALRRAVAERVGEVRRRIEAAGDNPGVRLVAVTKGHGPEAVAAALAAGVEDVGESYAQELRAKVDALRGSEARPSWHFVGRLQTNKVRSLAGTVALWQSVDRDRLGAELARRAPGSRVLVQVDLAGEPQKGGCPPHEVPGLVARLADRSLDVAGLMGVGPAGPPEAARPGFRALVELADRLGLAERSIGMSGDLEVAVAEGSTMVRVGTAIFGPRPAHPPTEQYGMGQ